MPATRALCLATVAAAIALTTSTLAVADEQADQLLRRAVDATRKLVVLSAEVHEPRTAGRMHESLRATVVLKRPQLARVEVTEVAPVHRSAGFPLTVAANGETVWVVDHSTRTYRELPPDPVENLAQSRVSLV